MSAARSEPSQLGPGLAPNISCILGSNRATQKTQEDSEESEESEEEDDDDRSNGGEPDEGDGVGKLDELAGEEHQDARVNETVAAVAGIVAG